MEKMLSRRRFDIRRKKKWIYSSLIDTYISLIQSNICSDPTPTPWAGSHKVNVLSKVKLVWIQSFPSPTVVAKPKLKNSVCPIVLHIAGWRTNGFMPFLMALLRMYQKRLSLDPNIRKGQLTCCLWKQLTLIFQCRIFFSWPVSKGRCGGLLSVD